MGVYISSYHKRRVDYEEIYRNGTCGGDFGVVIYGTCGRVKLTEESSIANFNLIYA